MGVCDSSGWQRRQSARVQGLALVWSLHAPHPHPHPTPTPTSPSPLEAETGVEGLSNFHAPHEPVAIPVGVPRPNLQPVGPRGVALTNVGVPVRAASGPGGLMDGPPVGMSGCTAWCQLTEFARLGRRGHARTSNADYLMTFCG